MYPSTLNKANCGLNVNEFSRDSQEISRDSQEVVDPLESPIKQHRNRIGLTQAQVDLLTGIYQSNLSYLETGCQAPTQRQYVALAKVFRTDVKTLRSEIDSFLESQKARLQSIIDVNTEA